MHNRGYLLKMKCLKDKHRKEIAKNFKCSRNFWLDEDEDRLKQCDYRLKKRFAKKLASRRARQDDNFPPVRKRLSPRLRFRLDTVVK